MEDVKANIEIALEVFEGLSSKPKYISSKYFYDARGSEIFTKIMRMPEYYLTDCEVEIFKINKSSLSRHFSENDEFFDIVELGAGDGMKTRILLKYLIDNMMDFRYIPVDISRDSNIKLVKNLKQDFENLIIEEKTGDYFEMIGNISKQYRNRKIIMFLGSNLGNYNFNESLDFLTRLSSVMTKNDKLLMGLDLKKDPQLIIKAYDDPYGYTRQFNLNLLERFNREIGSDFNVDNFIHFPDYDPHSGIAKSYLVSTKRQSIHFEEICKELTLYKWEPIYTEMSQKYDDQLIEKLAAHSGFVIEENYYDNNRYFVNTLWRKI